MFLFEKNIKLAKSMKRVSKKSETGKKTSIYETLEEIRIKQVSADKQSTSATILMSTNPTSVISFILGEP